MLPKEYGLVLAGGGTKGAYQVGVWKALKELKIPIKAVAGTSIGALNGALIIQDDLEKMENLYKNIKIDDIMKVGKDFDRKKNIFYVPNITKMASDYRGQKGISNAPLRKTIENSVDIDKIYNSDIDFGLLTVKAKDMSPVALFKKDIPKEKMIDYLLATSCFPIFKPQVIDGEEYLDGGLYDNVPINMLLKKGYKNIIVVEVAGIGIKRKNIKKDVYIKVISPNESLGGTFEFNHERISNNIQLGYLDCMRAFNKLQGHIYYFKSEEFYKMLEIFNLQTIYGLEYAAKMYNMDKHKEYKFEEFLKELKTKHLKAQRRYEEIRKDLKTGSIIHLKSKISKIFGKGLGLCMVMDMYQNRPTSKKFDYLNAFIQDYILSAKAMLELLNYTK